MSRQIKVEAAPASQLSPQAFNAIAAALVFFAYVAVFRVTSDHGLGDNIISSVTNMVPLLLLAAAARAVLLKHVIGRPPFRQLAAHVAMAVLFSLLLYWLLMVLIGVRNGDSPLQFRVEPFFPSPAAAWQLLQGLTLYGLVAAITYLQAQPLLPRFVVEPDAPAAEPSEPGLSRYFIRRGEDILPVEVSQIVSISGADDYAEVATLTGKHLVRMTLAEFEAALEGGRFIRVHRSRIVNVDRIQRAEPAGGGRMLLHMENGEIIQASRAGTKLLRDRML